MFESEEKSDHDLLLSISSTVESMHHRLFGNGNPGELDTLWKRTDSLQDWKNKVTGALIVLSFLITTLATATVYEIFKH